jgi:hypothetical protein
MRTAVQIFLTDPRDAARGAPVALPEAARPVLMQCPGCGGPLAITHDSPRTTRCQHCKADVYLPDDLWRRLHPAKTVREWYVRFEGETDREREAENARLAALRRSEMESQRAALAFEAGRRAEAAREAEADERDRALDGVVGRAKRNAYLSVIPLYAVVLFTIATLLLCRAYELALPIPAEGFIAIALVQFACAVVAAMATAAPIQKRLRAGNDRMMAYHWIWVMFSLFVFPFGPIVFVVGLKRFTGSLMASTVNQDSSGYGGTRVPAAQLTQRESWPAALFFLAMSLGVAGEIGAGILYGIEKPAQSGAIRWSADSVISRARHRVTHSHSRDV